MSKEDNVPYRINCYAIKKEQEIIIGEKKEKTNPNARVLLVTLNWVF